MNGDGACRTDDFAIDRGCGGDHAGVCINPEEPANVAGKGVGNDIRRRVEVKRVGGDTYCCSNGDILVDIVGFNIRICWRADIEFIEVIDRDIECLSCSRSITRGRLDGDRACGANSLAIERCSGGNDTCVCIDLEQTVKVAGQAVGNRICRCIEVECVGGDTYGGAYCDVFVHSIGCRDDVGWGSHVEFIDVVHCDRERLR